MDKKEYKELQEVKKKLKTRNIDTVGRLLMDVKDHNHKVQAEMVDLRKMVTQTNQKILEQQGQIDSLKMMGFKGSMGTGSTVHKAGE